jgi:transposase
MQTEKPRTKHRKYDANFKSEVLKMVNNGQSVSHISKALGIGENLIYRWKSLAKGEKKSEPISQTSGLMLSLASENEQLKQQLKQSELEREILKKALSIFSRAT